MALSEFFFERVTEEIHVQIEGVLALTERLARQHLPADAQACVAGVEEAAACVARLLDASRDLKRISAEGLDLSPQPRHLREIMDEVQERWISRARESGVTLLVSYEGDPDAAGLVDAGRIIQDFDGFIGQAMSGVRHGAVEASLTVSRPDEAALRLEGRVRGAGEVMDRSLSASVEDIDSRFGLETAIGAALGKRILEALNGHLRTEANAGSGETAVFHFDAPCAQAEEEIAPAAAAADEAAHVLIGDDNATNRMVAETLCEMFDCTTETAVDGVEAVELARSGRFDLILMDIKMPRMDGVAATRAIRGLPGPAAATPIIALTANADPEDAAAYMAAGMSGVGEKPMKPENLLRALQQALGAASAQAA